MAVIYGTGGHDVIVGTSGEDIIYAMSGNDMLTGGTGNDDYFIDGFGDTVIELAGEGNDRVIVFGDNSQTWTLPDHVEELWNTGWPVFRLGSPIPVRTSIGNALDNVIVGWSGDDAIDGGAGADRMYGGDGTPVMSTISAIWWSSRAAPGTTG